MKLDDIELFAKNQISICTSMMAGGVPTLPEPYSDLHYLADATLRLIKEIRQKDHYMEFVVNSNRLDIPKSDCVEMLNKALAVNGRK